MFSNEDGETAELHFAGTTLTGDVRTVQVMMDSINKLDLRVHELEDVLRKLEDDMWQQLERLQLR
jgi:hypothetical protein